MNAIVVVDKKWGIGKNNDLLFKLPEEMKLVVILRFFEDMKLSEIADVTGAALSTVKNRLYRALALLRLDMADEGRI